ncbi:MAG: MBOAT family protein [Dorea sp.]|nr:MBOAT family protein [Dorea sp.]
MIFNSIEFLIFFPAVMLIYFYIPQKLKTYWLLAASYYFYMCWNVKYILLLLMSTIITYAAALMMEHIRTHKKLIVAGSFITNLSILAAFKYYNFFSDAIAELFYDLGIAVSIPRFDVLLPVGISFYIFQALGYTMDVYRGEVEAEKNFVNYALFVSFFPQLVAGPIERTKNLLHQIKEPHYFEEKRVAYGLQLMVWGLFKKIVIADKAAILVDTVYGNYHVYGGWELVIATVLFAVQIYCDFSSYSDIAIGAAQVMGFTLMQNFRQPYFSQSVSEFWRRWHISLSTWFRDYLYIPLRGGRCKPLRHYMNLMIVFLVSGLWHGANWTYVIWGGINGCYQVIENFLKHRFGFKLSSETFGGKVFRMSGTFLLINFSWIFFRADNLSAALGIIKRMFSVNNPWIFFDGSLGGMGLDFKDLFVLFLSLEILAFVSILQYLGIQIRECISRQNIVFRYMVYVMSVVFIIIFGIYGAAYDATSFIYFQF